MAGSSGALYRRSMRIFVLSLLAVTTFAQALNLVGVWRYTAEGSKTAGPAPQKLVIAIEQNGALIRQRLVALDRNGQEQRMELRFDPSGGETANEMRGVPIKSRARWDGATLVAESSFHVANPPMEIHITERFSLAEEGKALIIDRTTRRNTSESAERVRFERGNDDDAAFIKRPEKLAGENYRNIQVLKSLPSSRLMELMISFQPALGVRCDHCHVPNEWHRDDKPAKLSARAMLRMTEAINRDHFDGRAAVQCSICHRGQTKPSTFSAPTTP